MAIQDLLAGLSGVSYQPTGAYSFEFRADDEKFIIFLLLGLDSISVSEPSMVDVKRTATGTIISDYGNDIKQFNLSGQTHFFYSGQPNTTGSKDKSDLDGYQEFMKLRYMLSRFRDYYRDGDSFKPDLSSEGLADVRKFSEKVDDLISDGDGALYNKVEVIFHDYDNDDHHKVVIQDFSYNQSNRDLFSIFFSVKLLAYKTDDGGTIKLSKENKPTAEQRISNVKENIVSLDIQRDTTQTAKSLSMLNNAVSNYDDYADKVLSGKYSAKTKQQGVVDDLITASSHMRETLYQEKSETGTEPLNEVLNQEQFEAYADLLKNELTTYSAKVANIELSDRRTVPTTTTSSKYSDVLTDQEFINQGDDQPTQDEEYGYKYYTILQGDNLQTIAAKFGSLEDWKSIGLLNDITSDDFEDDGLVGTKIKVPVFENSIINRRTDNLVYEGLYVGDDFNSLEKWFYGSDLYLNGGAIEADDSGDLAVVFGADLVRGNLSDRFLVSQGGFNPLNPSYGMPKLNGIEPYLVRVDSFITGVQSQLSQDPRVASVSPARRKATQVGDLIKVPISIELIGGSTIDNSIEVR